MTKKVNWGSIFLGFGIGVVLTSGIFYAFSTSSITLEIPVKPQSKARARPEANFDFYSELTKSNQETNTARVKTVTAPINTYIVRAGTFKTRAEADALRARLTLDGLAAKLELFRQGNDRKYRVILGPFNAEHLAIAQQKKLKLACNLNGNIEKR